MVTASLGVEFIHKACDLATERTFRHRFKLKTLGTALAEPQAELNSTKMCAQEQLFLHSMLITMHSHVEIVRLIVICSEWTAPVDSQGKNYFPRW